MVVGVILSFSTDGNEGDVENQHQIAVTYVAALSLFVTVIWLSSANLDLA